EVLRRINYRDQPLRQRQKILLHEVAIFESRSYPLVEAKTETVHLRCSEEGGRSMQVDILGKAIDIDELVAAAEPMPQRVGVFHLARGFRSEEHTAELQSRVGV